MSKTRIIEAVRNLDLESTKELLRAKPSLLTVTDRQGRNLLHLACSASCTKLNIPEAMSARIVTFLLDRGLDIESPMRAGPCGGCTALWFAVGRGRNSTLVKLLIKRGAKPTRAPGGALYAAGWYEDIDILDLLIRAEATIDVVVGITPFLACWCWRKFEAAKFLARKGADVNYQDPKGKTALHHGVEKEFDPALLKWLVKHGASPDIKDRDRFSGRQRNRLTYRLTPITCLLNMAFVTYRA
jgi:ankyrin repeat protein